MMGSRAPALGGVRRRLSSTAHVCVVRGYSGRRLFIDGTFASFWIPGDAARDRCGMRSLPRSWPSRRTGGGVSRSSASAAGVWPGSFERSHRRQQLWGGGTRSSGGERGAHIPGPRPA